MINVYNGIRGAFYGFLFAASMIVVGGLAMALSFLLMNRPESASNAINVFIPAGLNMFGILTAILFGLPSLSSEELYEKFEEFTLGWFNVWFGFLGVKF